MTKTETLETLETVVGNTIINHCKEETSSIENKSEIGNKIRIVPGNKWCFTAWQEYEETQKLASQIVKDDKKFFYVYGIEICPTTGKEHLQGFIQSKDKNYKIRPVEYFKSIKTHWEKSKGSLESNVDYCCKEGKYFTNITEYKPRKKVKDPMDGLEPFKWQKEILDIVKSEPDSRKIYWYWEENGCTGKSTLAKHLCMKMNALVVGGKGSDIKYAVTTYLETKDLEVMIYDIPRIQGNSVSYASIEEIKNGCMFSNKYESKMQCFNTPHIIVFANRPPDVENLSADRWVVCEIGI